MEFFVYCRDRPGTGELRDRFLEAHWSCMDGFAEAIIARGPTLAADWDTATGSLHIVDLPDLDAARAFAFEEPNYRAGVFDEVLVRRWQSVLGATMWEFDGDEANNQRFLVLGHGRPGATERRDQLRDAHRGHLPTSRPGSTPSSRSTTGSSAVGADPGPGGPRLGDFVEARFTGLSVGAIT